MCSFYFFPKNLYTYVGFFTLITFTVELQSIVVMHDYYKKSLFYTNTDHSAMTTLTILCTVIAQSLCTVQEAWYLGGRVHPTDAIIFCSMF